MFRTDLLSIIRSLNNVFSAIGICHTGYADCLLAGSQHNQYDTYQLIFILILVLILILIYLLTAVGLTPGGSSTVHVYTQTIHRTTKLKNFVWKYKYYCSTVYFRRITSIYQPTNAHLISHKTLLKHFKTLRHVSILSDRNMSECFKVFKVF